MLSERGSDGLSVHTWGAGEGNYICPITHPLSNTWLGSKHPSNLAGVGSSLLSSPGSLSQVSPLQRMAIR